MSGPLRLLHVIGSFGEERGGPIQVLKELARTLADRGHVVDIATTDAGPRGRRLQGSERAFDLGPGVSVHLAKVDLTRPPYPSAALALHLIRHARRYDLVHVHGAFNAPVSSSMWLCRQLRVPYLVRACGMLDAYSLSQHALRKRLWLAGLERDNLRHAARVQVSTAHEQREVLAAVPDARVTLLPQGVRRPPPPGPRPHPRPYLLFLSRVAKKKGLLLLLDAYAALRPRLGAACPDLVIAGPDEHGHRAEVEAHLRRLAAHAPELAQTVHLVGPVAGSTKSAWFAHAEAFVLPSDDENFGVVVIEAAHLGAPVLVSDRVGLADAVVETGAGLALPREAQAWTDGMIAVLARGRAAFSEATARLAAGFDWQVLGARLEDLYREVLAEALTRA